MKTKPPFDPEHLRGALSREYAFDLDRLRYVPYGEASWCFIGEDGDERYFVRVLQKDFSEASVTIPSFLKSECGIRPILTPVIIRGDELWVRWKERVVIVYPFLEGNTIMKGGLPADATHDIWTDIGRTVAAIHSTELPDHVARFLPVESYSRHQERFNRVLDIRFDDCSDEAEMELLKVVNNQREELEHVLKRTRELAAYVRNANMQNVICHADLHEDNLFLTTDGKWMILDWDGVMLAPRERDLMFIDPENRLPFYAGYEAVTGKVECDPVLLSYYRFEWVVQEVADFGGRVFLDDGFDLEGKRDAVEQFRKLFDNDVPMALNNDIQL